MMYTGLNEQEVVLKGLIEIWKEEGHLDIQLLNVLVDALDDDVVLVRVVAEPRVRAIGYGNVGTCSWCCKVKGYRG